MPERSVETRTELPIIQRVYDLILWYVPRLNKFPRKYTLVLGERIQSTLYGLLDAFFTHGTNGPRLWCFLFHSRVGGAVAPPTLPAWREV